MQVRKQQLELDMEQQTGSKSLAFLYTNNEKSEREIKESISFTTENNVCYRLIIYGLYYVEVGSFYANFLKSFNHK